MDIHPLPSRQIDTWLGNHFKQYDVALYNTFKPVVCFVLGCVQLCMVSPIEAVVFDSIGLWLYAVTVTSVVHNTGLSSELSTVDVIWKVTDKLKHSYPHYQSSC